MFKKVTLPYLTLPYVEGLKNMLTVVGDREKEIVITGDQNFDLKQSNKPASTKHFINMTKEFSLRQIINNSLA